MGQFKMFLVQDRPRDIETSALPGNDVYVMPPVRAATLTLAMYEHTRAKTDLISIATQSTLTFKNIVTSIHKEKKTQVENVFKAITKNKRIKRTWKK